MNTALGEGILIDYKSVIHIGTNIHIYINRKFNWFQKFMLRFCLGFEAEDIKEE